MGGAQGMNISGAGLYAIKLFEGLRLEPYRDLAGNWTIGYGHLMGTHERLDRISLTEAEYLLRKDIEKVSGIIDKCVMVPINQNQFDALASFIFNVGGGAFLRSTLLRELNAGNYEAAADQLLRWDKAEVLGVLRSQPGLRRRRLIERALFMSE